MKNVLLIEPNYQIRYPNLALMKFSAKHKKAGDKVYYVKGERFDVEKPDIIYISTMFTYYSKETIKCINFYKNLFPNAEIQVGGIFASLMPDYIEKKTGIKPTIGCIKELDLTPPDYEIVSEMIKVSPYIKKWEDFSILFTTRGCPRNCGFCAVKTLEPVPHIIPNWKEHIDLNKKHVMIQDNNITAMPFEHFKEVMEFLIKHKLKVVFNNGFDCRILTDEQIELMSKIKWYPGGLRLAFDHLGEDKFIQSAVKRLLNKGVSKSAFLIFTMYNFHDDVYTALYRHEEMFKLGVRPYPQIYRPLDSLDKKEMYIDENWTLKLIRLFRQYWLLAGHYKYKKFDEYLAENGFSLNDLIPKTLKKPEEYIKKYYNQIERKKRW